jgi:hypothetical protein
MERVILTVPPTHSED